MQVQKGKQPNPLLWLWIIPVIALTAWVFFPALRFGFLIWDDDKYILENLNLLRGDFSELMKATVAGNYHPLTLLSLKWNLAQGAPQAGTFHLWNIVLHSANTLLVVLLFRAYGIGMIAALAGGLFFGVHPLHVESVAWIAERKDVLYTFFLLLSWLAWKNPLKWNSSAMLGVALAFFVLSCLSKGMAIVLPFILALDVWFLQSGNRKAVWMRLIPFFMISIFFAGVAIWAQETVGAIRQSTDFTVLDKMLFPFYGVSFYLIKMVAPFNLSAVYPYPIKIGGMLPWFFYAAPLLVAVLGGLLYQYRKQPWLLFAASGFLMCLLPVLQILPVGNALTADRYFYVSSIPLFLGLFRIMEMKTLSAKPVFSLLLLLPGVLSVVPARERVLVWKDTMSLFSDVVSKYPQVAVGHYNMGNIWMNERQDYPAAIQAYRNAIAARPDYADAWTNLGVCLQYLQQYREAVDALNRAIILDPAHVEAYNNIGVGYEKLNITDSAVFYYRKAMVLNPSKVELYNNVGYAFEKMGQLDSAYFYYGRALELKPDYTVAMVNLGNCMIRRGFPQQDADVWFLKAARSGHAEAQAYLDTRGVAWR